MAPMYQEDGSKNFSPAEKRDLALAVFLDRLTALVDMVRPLMKEAVDGAVEQKRRAR
jgi:hypothetical protein